MYDSATFAPTVTLWAMTLTSHGFLSNGSIKKQLKARFYHFAIMASIKERAAALNLAEKLCVRPQGKFTKQVLR